MKTIAETPHERTVAIDEETYRVVVPEVWHRTFLVRASTEDEVMDLLAGAPNDQVQDLGLMEAEAPYLEWRIERYEGGWR